MEITVKSTTEQKKQIELPAYFCDLNCHVWAVFGEGESDAIQVTYSESGFINNSIATQYINCVQFERTCTKEYFEEKMKVASDFIEEKMKLLSVKLIEA